MKIIPPLRGTDRWGSGEYLAARGGRVHRGIDIACYKGSTILSPVSGTVTKLGYPYNPADPDKGKFRYVQITDDAGADHRIFYVEPLVGVSNYVERDDPIGVSQGIASLYPGMTDHVHYEIKRDGKHVEPDYG